jgi:single-strand DNA-binding protein
MNLNKVILIGRLTQDPQLKELPSGTKVANFGLATDRYFVDKSGQKRQETDFHNIVAFGKLAEIASQYLKKGSLAMIEGRIRTRNWQDDKGNQKTKTEIIAQKLQLGPKGVKKTEEKPEEIPVIEEEEINVDDIPF